MNSLTLIPASVKLARSKSSMVTRLSSEHQDSVQKLMDLPFPTFQRISCFIKGLSRRMHFHTQESEVLVLQSKKCSGDPYIARICCTQKFSGWVRIFQPNFTKKAVFTAADFRIPNPPSYLGRQILSQATKGIPLSDLEFFQKKSR